MNTKTNTRALAARQEFDADKLGKMVRLLASDKDGEVLAAVAAIGRSLLAAGMGFGDLASAMESGFKRPKRSAPAKWTPPEPDRDNWEALAWWGHYQRHHLRDGDKQYLHEVLLGDPRHFDCGRVPLGTMDRLRGIVAKIRAAQRADSDRW
jgi:hypothetical protein